MDNSTFTLTINATFDLDNSELMLIGKVGHDPYTKERGVHFQIDSPMTDESAQFILSHYQELETVLKENLLHLTPEDVGLV